MHGGYFGRLKENGEPVDPLANKDVFELASLGLAYGMYFNVTRDPEVEAELLAVRDLLFDKYYDPVGNRVKDTLTYDLTTELDPGANGGDITDLLVPGTALLLPYVDAAERPGAAARSSATTCAGSPTSSSPATRTRLPASNKWWFWGRTAAVRQLRREPHRLRPQHQVLRDDPQRQPGLPRPPVVLRSRRTATS